MPPFMNLQQRMRLHLRRPYHYRDRIAQFLYEADFRLRFKMSRLQVENLTRRIVFHLSSKRKDSRDISLIDRVLTFLRYLSGGTFNTVGDANGVNSSTANRYVNLVARAILDECADEIRWPRTRVERRLLEHKFRRLSQVPLVAGCLDGSHFVCKKPRLGHHQLFMNRHSEYSINAVAVSDADGVFLFFDTSCPGSYHDSAALRATDLFYQFEVRQLLPFRNAVLLADSAYPCLRWLIPSFRPGQDRAKRLYNLKHNRTRVSIERAFGQLKQMFPVLNKRIDLSYIENISNVVRAAVIVYNIVMRAKPKSLLQRAAIRSFNVNRDLPVYRPPQVPANLVGAARSHYEGVQRRLSLM